MKLGLQQSTAADRVMQWLRTGDQVFYLAGYAGTGKTKLAAHIASMVSGSVAKLAFTGKAALAMIKRGMSDARTIHSAMYQPSSQRNEELEDLESQLLELIEQGKDDRDELVRKLQEDIRKARKVVGKDKVGFAFNPESSLKDCRLIVLDECSMVNGKIGADILSFRKQVLVLGDPAQLRPVKGTGFFTERQPDFFLTEIHRTAADNPIIRAATLARQGQELPFMDDGAVRVVRKNDITIHDILAHDQAITGYNRTRRRLNANCRAALGMTSVLPQKGDRLICLRNQYNMGLYNGSLGRATTSADVVDARAFWCEVDFDDGNVQSIRCLRERFTHPEQEGFSDYDLTPLDYGNAITCHKAQGSEYPSVVICDDGFGRGPDRVAWNYTALTRAMEKVTVVR